MDRKKDEIFHKSNRNFQRTMDSRPATSRVTFNSETIETSFGGTQLIGNIKESSILSDVSQSLMDCSSDVSMLDERSRCQSRQSIPGSRSQSKDRTSLSTLKVNNDKAFVTPTKTSRLRTDRALRTSVQQNVETPDILKRQSQTPECFNPVTITPTQPINRSRRSDDVIKMEDCGITVAVRVRPFTSREIEDDDVRSVVSMIDNETFVTSERGDTYNFAYDYSFWSCDKTNGDHASQQHVYEAFAQPMLGKAFEGYNTCLFAYGQTGSGKSYSIMGHSEESGIIPRFCEELFDRIGLEKRQTQINVEISYFEIYNEKIHDLLAPSNKDKSGWKVNLKVREHPSLGPYVEELSSYVVKSFDDVKSWLDVGNKHRATASTGMNDKSSRSHSVFTMFLSQTKSDIVEGKKHESTTTSKINIVDLAGSERQSLAKTSGDRLREGASINKSLMTLGKVISLLSEQSINNMSKKKKLFIPYRDSVLTWLLKESLGGNSKTAMLATISPSNVHVEETLSTLRYAQQARFIINSAQVNEDPKARLIRELRAEIDKMKAQGVMVDDETVQATLKEIDILKRKLAEKENEIAAKERSWQERLKTSEETRIEEYRLLEMSGIAFSVDHKMPHLVNLNEDPQLSEMLVYVLKEGQMKVGRVGGTAAADIQLSGALIADKHCIFVLEKGRVYLTPLKDAPTYVNGSLIQAKTNLNHGDRVILGGDHYFRFSHPSEAPSSRKSHPPGPIKDFEFARQELIVVQNAKLEAELEERKRKESELQEELARQEYESQRRLDEEVERTRRLAEEELNEQRDEYENKLHHLEKEINDHRKQQFASEQQRLQADDEVRKLQEQKMRLEQEVLVNRKNMEKEAIAAQQALKRSRVCHSGIVEQLERENIRVQEEVKRLAVLRQQKQVGVITPKTTPRTPAVQASTKKDLYKITLKVQEANKISQHLQKDTAFSREEFTQDGEVQTVVKVTNTKLGISTLWTLETFERRLLHMREMYQLSVQDAGTDEFEEVFYDPNDTWEKEARINTPNGLSPRVVHGLRRQISSDTPKRLQFNHGTPSSQASGHGSISSSTAVSDNAGRHSPVFCIGEANGLESVDSVHGLSTAELCRDQITAALDTYKGSAFRELPVDKLLCQCDVLYQRVTLLLDTYNIWISDKANREASSLLRQLLCGTALEMSSSVQLVLTTSALWSPALSQVSSAHVTRLYDNLVTTIRKLANQLVLFLQGCENDIDSMVKESSAGVMESLRQCCHLAGELSIATATPLLCLQDTPDGSTIGEDYRCYLSVDLQLYVTNGCQVFVERTLSLSLHSIEESQARIMMLQDQLKPGASLTDALLCPLELTVASSRDLLSNMKQTKLEFDSAESSSEQRGVNFFHRKYVWNQLLISQITNLADSVSLLVDTCEPLATEQDEDNMRRLIRCVDMVLIAANKITATVSCDPSTSLPSESQIDISDLSILTDSQVEQLEHAVNDIRVSVNSFNNLAHSSLWKQSENSVKLKRVLPMSPKNESRPSAKIQATGSIVRKNLAIFQK